MEVCISCIRIILMLSLLFFVLLSRDNQPYHSIRDPHSHHVNYFKDIADQYLTFLSFQPPP